MSTTPAHRQSTFSTVRSDHRDTESTEHNKHSLAFSVPLVSCGRVRIPEQKAQSKTQSEKEGQSKSEIIVKDSIGLLGSSTWVTCLNTHIRASVIGSSSRRA